MDPPDQKRTVLHARGNEKQSRFIDDELFLVYPQFDLGTEFPGVFRIIAKEADDLVHIMGMGLGTALRGMQVPRTVHLKGSRDDVRVDPEYAFSDSGISRQGLHYPGRRSKFVDDVFSIGRLWHFEPVSMIGGTLSHSGSHLIPILFGHVFFRPCRNRAVNYCDWAVCQRICSDLVNGLGLAK